MLERNSRRRAHYLALMNAQVFGMRPAACDSHDLIADIPHRRRMPARIDNA
jgi:hypothetical protein